MGWRIQLRKEGEDSLSFFDDLELEDKYWSNCFNLSAKIIFPNILSNRGVKQCWKNSFDSGSVWRFSSCNLGTHFFQKSFFGS